MADEGLANAPKGRVVTGVIGADVHVVGNRLLAMALERAGFKVINLGVLVSQEEFINAAVESNADALFISSLYGHAELDCEGLREKCIEAGLDDILIYVGGNVALGKQEWSEVEKRFLAMGIDRVFPPRTPPKVGIELLERDLAARKRSKG
ncbi:MAG: methylaspartate mutase subunit S [Chloroflexi bacterium]|nr:methylaspartate mutase subunit S [Chloroflexota bacterium]